MAPFLFLLVLIPLAFSSVHGHEDTRHECLKERRFQDCISCQGVEYSFPGYYSQNFLESCNVEPKAEYLVLQDSVWLAYDCHVRAWLNGTELTKQSFVTWISQLPQSNQSAFWNVFPPSDRMSVDTAADEETKIRQIKSYFFEYLQGVYEICLSEDEQNDGSEARESDDKIIWKKLTRSLVNCTSGPLPRFLFDVFPDHDSTQNCRTEFSKLLGNSTYAEFRGKVLKFCYWVSPKLSINELVKEDLDFQTVLNGIIPKFWSKATKTLAKATILRKLSSRLDCKTTKVEDVIPKLWVDIEKDLEKFQRVNSTLDTTELQTLRNLHFAVYINSVLSMESFKMCYPN